jgi:hypothetical protein
MAGGKGMSDIIWCHSWTEKAGRYDGECRSRQEAIEEGRQCYGLDEAFYVLACRRPTAAEFVPDVDWFVDTMAQCAHDTHGEVTDDFPEVDDEARRELRLLMETWADKHIGVPFWVGTGSSERIGPEGEN